MKRTVIVRDLPIGGGNRVTVQSMTNTLTKDINATVIQIKELEAAGCDIVRVSVPDIDSATALNSIIENVSIPVVADIHYDYRLAVKAVESGAHKIRINPGNIGGKEKIGYLARYLMERKIPIRIGVNSGSVEKDILTKYGNTSKALVESALYNIGLLESAGFYDIIVSVKSSSVPYMIEAYRELDRRSDYPLHLGVTEAGYDDAGLIKSSVGLGVLLYQGIGDTIRVSLSGNPVREVYAARRILQSLGISETLPEIISCPTCARTNIEVERLAGEIDKHLRAKNLNIKVAVMGCVVNGPGEAAECDIGVAGGREKSAIFIKGKVISTVDNDRVLDELLTIIEKTYG
ncbi:MAG: flavodoxin-dependent (E)-4-hydroxy-3-methylbut-2-enyl-diphosphate synthase [Christensenellales bacterium]|jgi:(E)-4-hydroxy-3-methylbut-2-enyl-diphosphate synthase